MKRRDGRGGIALLLSLLLALQLCLTPMAVLAEDQQYEDGTELLEIEYTVDGFDVEYDGTPHSIKLNVKTSGVTVYYATDDNLEFSPTNPTFTEPGMYTIFYILTKNGYQTADGSVTAEIRAIDISSEVKSKLPSSFSYTGKPVSFSLPTDKIKEWAVTYGNGDGLSWDAPVNPGSYTVTISGESEDGRYRASFSHSFTIVEVAEDMER